MPSLVELRIGRKRDSTTETISFGPLREQLELLELPTRVKFMTDGIWKNLKTLIMSDHLVALGENQIEIVAADGWAPHLRELHVSLDGYVVCPLCQ